MLDIYFERDLKIYTYPQKHKIIKKKIHAQIKWHRYKFHLIYRDIDTLDCKMKFDLIQCIINNAANEKDN